MSLADILYLTIRWIHAIAAVTWIGGGIFLLIVLQPALVRRNSTFGSVAGLVGKEFRSLVETCVVVLVITGIILALQRLTSPVVGVNYVAVLGLKIALALGMFSLAWARRGRGHNVENRLSKQTNDGDMASSMETLNRISLAHKLISGLKGVNLIVILGLLILLLSDLLGALYEVGLRG
jgi:uncharacterized membrane protein